MNRINCVNAAASNRLTATRKRTQTNNFMVRQALSNTGMYYWELADILGISVETLRRRLRHELPTDEQKRICELITEATVHE